MTTKPYFEVDRQQGENKDLKTSTLFYLKSNTMRI